MKKLIFIILVLFYSVHYAQTVTVGDVIQRINQDRIADDITLLQNLGTRYFLSPMRFLAARYIQSQFESMGFTDVKRDSFQSHATIGLPYYNPTLDTVTTQINVIATLPGSETPEEIYIICAHYDSYSITNPMEVAPGADENASGVAAVLESARAIMESGFRPKSTLRFVTFAAAYFSRTTDTGPEHYAAEVKSGNDDIKLIINNSMIGYTSVSLEKSSVRVFYSEGYKEINRVIDIAENYSAIDFIKKESVGGYLREFTNQGYDGLHLVESIFNSQNYHRSTDLLENLDLPYMTEVIKGATAVLIGMDESVLDIEEKTLPEKFTLQQNYPNPFNPATRIKYSLPERSFISLKVFDVLGREIKTIFEGIKNPGNFSEKFDGSEFSSGIYFYTLRTNESGITKKMILLK